MGEPEGTEVGNRGEPRTMSGSQNGEPGGTKNRVGEPRRGTDNSDLNVEFDVQT